MSVKDNNINTDDTWNRYATRSNMVRQPTGKYRVPCNGDTMTQVIEYFSKYCETIFVHAEGDDYYVIYFDGKWQVPRPSVVYLNADLLRNYHIKTTEYWDSAEMYVKKFKMMCSYNEGEIIILDQGRHIDTNGLPSTNGYESFRRKLYASKKATVTIRIEKEYFGKYIGQLARSFPTSFPMIQSTVNRTLSNVDIVSLSLQFERTEQIFNCFGSGFYDPIISIEI